MMRSKLIIIVSLVLCLALLIALQVMGARNSSEANVTTASPKGMGLSIFKEYAKRYFPDSFFVKRSAVLDQEYLEALNGLLILSPQLEVSEREAALIDAFVRKGGLLFLSSHTEQSWSALKHLRRALQLELELEENDEFVNYQPILVKAPAGVPLFEPGGEYAFYSRHVFSGNSCANRRFNCFVAAAHRDAGDVVVVTGLPPFTNALLPHAHNDEFAAHLIPSIGAVAVDEYRHFFSDKSLSDLLLEPSFTLPILALVLGALVFFVLGYSEPHALQVQGTQPIQSPSFHDFTTDTLRGLVNDPSGMRGAVELIAQQLIHRFPESRDAARDIVAGIDRTGPLGAARQIIGIHRRLLSRRTGAENIAAAQFVANGEAL